MARPKSPNPLVVMAFRTTTPVKARLEAVADAQGRKTGALLNDIVLAWYKEQEKVQ